MHNSQTEGKADSELDTAKSQIKSLRWKVRIFPVITFTLTILLSFLGWFSIAAFPVSGSTPMAVREYFPGYLHWLASLPTTIGKDVDLADTLPALGALTIAIFLTLYTTGNSDDSSEPIIVQAQHIVLSEISIITAFITAFAAWFTIPLVGINETTIPETVIGASIAILCSAVVPLHRARSTALRLNLHEARNQLKRLQTKQLELDVPDKTDAKHLSRRRPQLALAIWLSAIATINSIFGLVFYLQYANNPSLLLGTLFTIIVFVTAGGWAGITASAYGDAFLERARHGRYRSGVFSMAVYSFTTLTSAIGIWAAMASRADPIWSGVIVVTSTLLFSVGWVIDRR